MRKKCNRTYGEELEPYRNEIKRLHSTGISPDEIAEVLDKERTTILYHLRFLQLKPHLKELSKYGKQNYRKPIYTNKGRIKRLTERLDEKYPKYKINRGKLNYKAYLEADKK